MKFALTNAIFLVVIAPSCAFLTVQPRHGHLLTLRQLEEPPTETEMESAQLQLDVMATKTVETLESTSPKEMFGEASSKKAPEGEEEPFDPAKQIFDPLSFWTERSGRFPRRK